MTGDTEHLDPNSLPPWLLEHAKNADPSALGWLAAGYLAGINVGKKTGPCMATLDLMPVGIFSDDAHLVPLSCELAHGHVGGHSNGKGAKWIDLSVGAPPEPTPTAGADTEELVAK